MLKFGRWIALCLVFTSVQAWAAQALRVGMSADYPPLHYLQEGKIVGIEADAARAVGQWLGQPIELVKLPFEDLFPALKEGRIDVIMSGISDTRQRSEEVSFTNSYLSVGQMAIMHRSKLGHLSQPWALYEPGIRIGVEPGTTGEAFAKDELDQALLLLFDNPDDAFKGLREDRIDLYLHDAPTSWLLAQSNENDDLISLYRPLTNEHLAWAVRKGDKRLLRELNHALAQMRQNGTLGYIVNRWIPVQVEVN